MIKKTLIRAVRKSSHLSKKASKRATRYLEKVERKTTNILLGSDKSFGITESVPLEKLYYSAIPHIIPLHPALPKIGRTSTVTLLIPSLDNKSFFGGTATALIIALTLAEKLGKDLRIVQTLEHGDADMNKFLEQESIKFTGDIKLIDVSSRTYNRYGYIDIHPDDIFLASAWWDAYIIDRLPLTTKYIYLIQDFEPIFYNNSDKYILAESTYRSKNFIALCNTKLMFDFMIDKSYISDSSGTWFEPAVARQFGHKSVSKSKKQRLFLYGRRNVDRNLFFTGLQSVSMSFDKLYLDPNEWEVFMAGQEKVPTVTLSSGINVTNLGKMSMEDYLSFIKTVDVAVSLMMAPHPNYPTLEFASAGSSVVTTRYELKQDLTKYSKNIIMADESVDSIAKAIAKAASISEKERQHNAVTSKISRDWTESLETPLNTIIKQLGV